MNTLRYALRFLARQKVFTLINVLGLALSLACCIMLTRYLHREYSIDRHVIDGETVGEVIRIDNSSHAMAYYQEPTRKAINDIAIESCYYCPLEKADIHVDTITYFANALMVDSTYLHFFRLPLEGDRHALSRPDGTYVSRRLAQQWFGEKDPIGQAISLYDIPLTICGIFDEPACKQSIVADLYVPYLVENRSFNHALMEGSRWIRLASSRDKEKLNR